MILPVYAFGHPVLREKCKEVAPNMAELQGLIDDMWETMYASNGVGLAAPQIGKNLRLFLVDTLQIEDDEKRRTKETGIKEVFINPEIIAESGNVWAYEEGCLSIPNIRGDVSRQSNVRIRYLNAAMEICEREFDGMNARVIQHEYDHIEGVLFIDKLNPLKRRMIQRRLDAIKQGRIEADYVMKFAPLKR